MKRSGGSPLPELPPPPPYPRRRSAIPLTGTVVGSQNKTEGTQSVVVGGIGGRNYYFRRCKKVVSRNIESLPNEVLIEILVRLSTDEILEKARFVCLKWYHIIHSDAFLNAHLEYSNSNSNWGVLFTNIHYPRQPFFLGVGQDGKIELSELFYKCYVPVEVSCNGLAVAKSWDMRSFHMVNFSTKQVFHPPPALPYDDGRCSFGLAYASASMEYKLFRTYKPYYSPPLVSHIFTVGVDKDWRSVGVDNLSCEAKMLLRRDPLITQGFMHWTCGREGTRVLTLNVETEVFTESCVPLLSHPADDGCPKRKSRRLKIYISTWWRLCLFSACGDWVWEVWEMEGESGEWRKLLPNIDLEAHALRVQQELYCDKYYCCGFIEPIGWLKYPVLLAIHFGATCIVYNLVTDKIDYSFELPSSWYHYSCQVHKKTLEWLR